MNPGAADNLREVFRSGLIGQGPKVEQFEKELSTFLGHPAPITVNSATSGMTLALRLYLGEGTTGEVLSQPITCTATNWAILAANQHIKWVDTDPLTGNMDLEDLKTKLSERTKAIMVVHWAGQPVDLGKLKQIQQDYERQYGQDLPIIEDAAHAFGAEYDGMKLGNHGNATVYSFQAIKHLTCGDGGALLLPGRDYYLPKEEQLVSRAKLLRWYGLDRTKSDRFRCEQDIVDWGYKFHMNDINATIGLENLKSMKRDPSNPTEPGVIGGHQRNAAYLEQQLGDVPGISLLVTPSRAKGAHWIFTLLAERRDDLQRKLEDAGIASGQVHRRNDEYSCVKFYKKENLPGTAIMQEQMLSLPCGWWVNQEGLDHIVRTIKSGW